jgi:hypothetical protein
MTGQHNTDHQQDIHLVRSPIFNVEKFHQDLFLLTCTIKNCLRHQLQVVSTHAITSFELEAFGPYACDSSKRTQRFV